MKELTYIPFGAQYYRAPTPLAKDWERDLKSFRDHGFNTVKLWVQWRWNMPERDIFDFTDIDCLMDICNNLGIMVVLNIIYDVAPAWYYREYPDSLMIAADDRRVHPQTTAWRQIGGAPGPCLHHPEGIAIRRQFTEETVKRYANHPALLCWDLWNEPELTCGILRDPTQENMVCYCEHSILQFKNWIKKRYKTLDALSSRWGQRFSCWEDIEPPRYAGTFNDMLDWREFFADALVKELHMRAEATRKYDQIHSVMVHSVPGFDYMNTCSEEFLLAREMDWFGNSAGSDPFPAFVTTTAAKGKCVINAEIHALGGNTLARPDIPDFEEMKRHILIPFTRGIKGFLFWQYKPERLGWEAPAWGLTGLDGEDTPWLEYTIRINRMLQENRKRLLPAFPRQANIAIVDSRASELFLWAISTTTDLHKHSVNGVFQALYEANYAVDILSEHQLIEDGLTDYDVVYYPLPYYVDSRTAKSLKHFVKEGGVLLSEALFGGIDSETNLHAVRLPGYGFDEVFGCLESQTTTASVFRNAYEGNWADSEESRSTIVFADIHGRLARGYYFRQSLTPTKGQILARYENGDVAATVNQYGKGKAVLTGTCTGFMSSKYECEDSRRYIVSLIQEIAGLKPCGILEGGKRCDILYRDDKPEAVILQWNKLSKRFGSFADPVLQKKTLYNPLSGMEIRVDECGNYEIPDSEGQIDLYLINP